MIAESLARRYASALYHLAIEQDILVQVYEDFSLINQLLNRFEKFRHFLISPRVPTAEKKQMFQSTFGDTLSPILLHFLFLLLDKKRQTLLQLMYNHLSTLYNNYYNRTDIRVKTAVNLKESAYQEIKQVFEKKLTKTVAIKQETDPSLIGGIQIRVGNTIYDASIKKQLTMMRRLLLQRE